MLKRRLLDVEPEPARFGAPAVAVRMGRVAHGAVIRKLCRVQRQLDRGFRGTGDQVRIPAAAGGLHAGGGDVGEAVVDGVVGGEGGHGGNQGALRDVDGDAVFFGAGVGDDAVRIIHDHWDRRGVDRVARRGRALHKVVFARGEELLLRRREGCEAVGVSGHGIVGLGIGVDPIGAIGHRQGFCGIEIEDRAGQGLLSRAVIHLFHIEMVLNVGDIDGGGKLAVEVFAVDPMGVLLSGQRKVACLGVIERDVVGCVRIVAPVIIVPEIAGAVFKFGHVRTVCRGREDDGVAVGHSFVLQGFDHGGDISAVGSAACHLPAGQCAAGDNAPFICGGRLTLADVVHTAHDDGEEQALVFVKICRFLGLILCCGHGDVGAGGNGSFEGRISAGGPAVVFVVEKDGVRVRIIALQHKINAVVVAIAGAVFVPLLENEILNAALVQVVETDRDIVRIGEDETAVFIRGAGADGVLAGLDILVCAVGLFFTLGGVEVKLDAGEEGAVLIDLDAVGLGDVGQVEFHCEVRIRAAALEIEELERMVGVVGEGVFAGGPIRVFAIVFRHLSLQRSGIFAVDGDCAVGEVDGRCGLIVDAAEVGHEDAVDEDPDVVVTRKLEGHGLVAALGGHAAVALHEARDHGEAEQVVYGCILRVDSHIRHQLAVVVLCKNVEGGWAIEGEELAFLIAVTILVDAICIVDRERAGLLAGFIEIGIVCRLIGFPIACLIIIGVEIVVAVIVDPEQASDVPERLFAERAALHAVRFGLFRLVEEIAKGLLTGKAAVFFQAGVVSWRQHRIAAGQTILHNPGPDAIAARIFIDADSVVLSVTNCHKAQVMARIDAGCLSPLDAVVHSCTFGDPIVEQVDLHAGGRDSIGDGIILQHVRADRR